MKKYFGILLITSFIGLVELQAQTDKAPFLSKSLAGSIKAVKVQTSGGSITVEGMTGGESRVEMYVQSNDRHDNLTKEQIQKKAG